MSIGIFIIPILILIIFSAAIIKKVPVYDTFVSGVKEGFMCVFKIAPYLLTMLFAIDIFRKSGALNFIVSFLKPVFSLIGMPEGVIPMFIIKPLSGSASLSMMTDIIKNYGVESREGVIAAVMMGSTETIFYTLTVYFGSCNVKRTRHSLIASIVAHVAGCIAAIYICSHLIKF